MVRVTAIAAGALEIQGPDPEPDSPFQKVGLGGNQPLLRPGELGVLDRVPPVQVRSVRVLRTAWSIQNLLPWTPPRRDKTLSRQGLSP